jgi:serine/threonine protein kinase
LSCLRGFIGVGSAASTSYPASIVVNGATIRIRKLLGEGGYAFVFAATRYAPLEEDASASGSGISAGQDVALKRFVTRDAEALSTVLTEIELHRALSPHPTVVNYIDHQRVRAEAGAAGRRYSSNSSLLPCEEDSHAVGDVWLVMEMATGSLREVVDKRVADFAKETQTTAAPLAPFTPGEIKRILVDIVDCLAHLHSQRPPVAHHDLKFENILIGTTGKHQLCDFGSARRNSITCKTALQVNRGETMLDATMTMLYRPPEACDLWQGGTVDTQADLWALGVLLYTMLTGKMPFDANPRQILAGQYEPIPADVSASEEYKALCDLCVNGLLVADPSLRLDVDGVSAKLHALDPLLAPKPHKIGNVRAVMPPISW